MRIFAAAVLSLVISFTAVSPVATADTAQGVVKSIQGLVRLKHLGVEAWGKVRKGDPVRDGDVLRTMEDSKIQLAMKDGGIVTVGPLATLEVRDPQAAEGAAKGGVKARLKLLIGSIFARVSTQKTGREFSIETPIAVASVKGCGFAIRMNKGSTLDLVVTEGLVSLSNSMGSQDVKAGHLLKLLGGQAPPPPSKFDPKNAPGWMGGLVGSDNEDKFIRATIKGSDGVEHEVVLKFSNK